MLLAAAGASIEFGAGGGREADSECAPDSNVFVMVAAPWCAIQRRAKRYRGNQIPTVAFIALVCDILTFPSAVLLSSSGRPLFAQPHTRKAKLTFASRCTDTTCSPISTRSQRFSHPRIPSGAYYACRMRSKAINTTSHGSHSLLAVRLCGVCRRKSSPHSSHMRTRRADKHDRASH